MSDLQRSLLKLKEASDLLESDATPLLSGSNVESLHAALNEMHEQLEAIKSKIDVSEQPAIRYVD